MSKLGEIRSLTGLRGVAAACVAFAHLSVSYPPPWWVTMWTFPESAVDFFFCLSGFCLCLAYRVEQGREFRIGKYFQARFARIYPLYALSLFLIWWSVIRQLGGSGYYPNPFYWQDAIRNVLMVNTWPIIGSGSAWNPPAWSLSVEVLCYILLFPLFVRFFASLADSAITVRCSAVVLLIFVNVFAFAKYWNVNLVMPAPYHAPLAISYWVPLICAATMFAGGCIAYSFYFSGGKIADRCGRLTDSMVILALLYLVLCQFWGWPKEGLAMFGPPFILGLANNKTSLAARLLESVPVHWLGCISYSLYLLHVPVDFGLHALWRKLSDYPALDISMTFSVPLMCSAASYYLFEMPMRRFLRSIRRNRPDVSHANVP